ncbi:hypothetical protein ACFW04_012439 [Cataglyphis niger]
MFECFIRTFKLYLFFYACTFLSFFLLFFYCYNIL